jgi:hypothetical protein
VALYGFKPYADARKGAWVGSIPTRSRHMKRLRAGGRGAGATRSMTPIRTRWAPAALGALLTLVLAQALAQMFPHSAAAQVRDTVVVVNPVPTPAEQADDLPELPELDEPTTPGGAFLRAVLLPGWGHASIGAYTRGGFYFAAETTAGFLLARTVRRLGAAKDARDLKEDRLRAQLLGAGRPADSVDVLVQGDPEVARAQRLVRSRRQQMEDWAALGLFFVFLSGADAFVSAHLRDFPEPVTLDVVPAAGGAVGVGLSVPVGRRRPGR